MDDVTQIGIWPIIAFCLPLLVSLVKQARLSTQANSVIALLVYIASGIAYVIVTAGPDGFTVEEIISSVTVATVVGTAAYNLFWSNLGKESDDSVGVEERLTIATSFLR
jgi:hypothetical protein